MTRIQDFKDLPLFDVE